MHFVHAGLGLAQSFRSACGAVVVVAGLRAGRLPRPPRGGVEGTEGW